MQVVSHWNLFKTEAAAWLDIGIYRFAVEADDLRPFEIAPLNAYDPSKVSDSHIYKPHICFHLQASRNAHLNKAFIILWSYGMKLYIQFYIIILTAAKE